MSDTLKVNEIFSSIQGEGKLLGTPMTFVRLYGCNLSCPGCDTPLDGHYVELSILEILDQVTDRWVGLTGGEPTIQRLDKLVNFLKSYGHKVAMETNGTNPIPDGLDWICVSPKESWPRVENLEKADEVKVLVGSGMYEAEDVISEYPFWIEKATLMPWWDEHYKSNLEKALKLCQKYQIRLTIQAHKYLEVK